MFQLNSDDNLVSDPKQYRRVVGKLLYLTMTRSDIAYTVQHLSQFVQSPKQSHINAALRGIRYVKGCPGQGIYFAANNPIDTVTA